MMRFIMLLCISAVLLVANPVFGYVLETTRTGAVLHWEQSQIPVPWSLNAGGAPELGQAITQQTLTASFGAWSDVECSFLSFSYKGVVTVSPSDVGTMDYDGDNVMIWIEPGQWPGEWVDAFAVTVPLFEENSGRIVDADILFNRNFDWSIAVDGEPGKADLQSIATHEIGHLLGLDHTPPPDATMFWSAVEGETHKRSLAADDIQGICFLYPVEGKTGSPCAAASDCEAGRDCVEHASSGGSICSDACTCTSDCSAAFTCLDSHCLPPEPEVGGIGSKCSTTLPCGDEDMICVSGICSTYCKTVDDCPDQWQCVKLLGDPGSACYTNNPNLLPQDKPNADASITDFRANPVDNVLPRTSITLTCSADSESSLQYRFSVRPVGGDWEIIRDFSTNPVSYWVPDVAGAYELRAEVLVVDDDSCPEDERVLSLTIVSPGGNSTDGDTADGDGESDDGGCHQTSSSAVYGLAFLLMLALTVARRRA
jgi:hypothetical protein